MADADKAKAEKIAAAKKRVQEMKKKQKAKAGSSAEKKEEQKEDKKDEKAHQASPTPEPEASTAPAPPADETPTATPEEDNADVAPLSPTKNVPPSLAQQSRARSASFRAPSISGSPGMFSPEGETAPDIYRKHVARIEELEKENKRLAKEASDAESRWQKAETELDELRDGDDDQAGDNKDAGEAEKLRNDVAALQRQNDQLQSQLAVKGGAGGGRHQSSPSISVHSPPAINELEAQLSSKSATIETMELEMSRLRAQVERLSLSSSTPSEQISALEEKLARAEKAAALAQRELGDLKRNLERTAEKAVKAGSGLASAETKIRTLEKEVADVKIERDELVKKVEGLEKKVSTLTTLHKEQDGRMQAIRKEKEAKDKEVLELKNSLETVEADNVRLRKKDAAEGGGEDDGLDELENEGRLKLEKRIHDLEAENTDLRRGIWHEKRKEMQLGPDDTGKFTDVDLGGNTPHRRKSIAPGGGIGEFFSHGLNALTGHAEDGGFLEDEEEMEFDEEAFRKAQEEDAKNRLERIREIKRGLKNWEGWSLDLVENRTGGGEGIGEIFEI